MKNKIILGLQLVWFFLVFCTPARGATPQECAQEINTAIESRDVDAFQQLVDMDAILDQALTTFLAQIQKPGAALPPLVALMLSQAATQETIRKLLLQESKAFVLNGIASGAFAGKPITQAQRQGMLAPLFAQASLGKKQITRIGNAFPEQEGWLLPMTVHDYGNDGDYPVIGRFTPDDQGTLRLTGVENLDQLFAQIQREAAEE